MKAFIIRPDVHDRNPSMFEAQVDGCELQAILGFRVRPKQKQKAINSLKKKKKKKKMPVVCIQQMCLLRSSRKLHPILEAPPILEATASTCSLQRPEEHFPYRERVGELAS